MQICPDISNKNTSLRAKPWEGHRTRRKRNIASPLKAFAVAQAIITAVTIVPKLAAYLLEIRELYGQYDWRT